MAQDHETGPMYYELSDEEINGLLDKYAAETDVNLKKSLAREIIEKVRSWNVEIPCYVLTDYIVYNAVTIDRSSLAEGHSLYWTWIDDITSMKLKKAE